jgi:hypothetical protein
MLLWAEPVAQMTAVRTMYIILGIKPAILHNEDTEIYKVGLEYCEEAYQDHWA